MAYFYKNICMVLAEFDTVESLVDEQQRVQQRVKTTVEVSPQDKMVRVKVR